MFDKYYFINRLPNIELSYDEIIHKKVYGDYFMLIPKGTPVIIWFTTYKNEDVCVLMHINKYKQFTKIEIVNLCFKNELSYNTIILGRYFINNNIPIVTFEDIYYYMDEEVSNYIFEKKINIFKNIFSEQLQQKAYTKQFVIMGLPIMTENLSKAYNYIKHNSYDIYGIKIINSNLSKNNRIIINKVNNNIQETIFKIKANINQDIYSLYCSGNKGEEFYNYAGVFSYKTSVMMNNIFRNIKENKNLDLLEMSDDDEEFENINEDKFINLKKSVYMKCKFNKKFKKWEPIECIKFTNKLSNKHELYKIEYNK